MASRNAAKRTASANLVAVESLQPGDEILTPWGRDRIDTISQSYNVAITERKRQIPLKRNGRPNLVKRADPYAASRRTASAAKSKPIKVNWEFDDEVIPIEYVQTDVNEWRYRDPYTPDTWDMTFSSIREIEQQLKSEGMRKVGPAGASRRAASASIFTVHFENNDLQFRARQALRRMGVTSKSPNGDGSTLVVYAPSDSEIRRQVDEVLEDLGARDGAYRYMGLSRKSSRKFARKAAQANLRLISLLAVARLAPILQKLGMSQQRADELARILQRAKDAQDAYDKLQEELGSRADYIAKKIGLNDVKAPRVPPGYKQVQVNQLLPGDQIIVYPHGQDVVDKVSSGRNAVKTKGGLILAGKATVYVKASRRAASAAGREDFVPRSLQVTFNSAQNAENAVRELRRKGVKARIGYNVGGRGQSEVLISMPREPKFAQDVYRILDDWDGQASTRYTASRRTASAALPALLAVARIAPILLRFGITAARAQAIAAALQKAGTVAEAVAILTKFLGGGAANVAKALGLEEAKSMQASRQRRTARAFRTAPRLVDKRGRLVKPGDELTDFRGDKATFVKIVQLPNDQGSTGKIEVEDEAGETWVYYPSVFGLEIALSRLSARAGWRGADDEQKPVREKFGSLARMLAQYNVTDPRKLPDEARKGFNSLLAAVVERSGEPAKDVVDRAVAQAKQYAEQMATQASRPPARATSDSAYINEFVFGDVRDANVFVHQVRLLDSEVRMNGPSPITRGGYWIKVETDDIRTGHRVDMLARRNKGKVFEMSRRSVRASTVDDTENLTRILVDYQVDRPSKLPPDAQREFWALVAKISQSQRGGSRDTPRSRQVRASRATRLARRACRAAQASLRRKPAASAAYPGFKDSAKVGTLKTFRVSLKVDAREGSYESAKELADHIDGALQAAGLNAYDVYVR